MKVSRDAGRISIQILKERLLGCAEWVGGILLYLLHLLYSLCLLLTPRSRELPWTARSQGWSLQVSAFTKIPSHLALVLGPEEASYGDIVNLITWSIPAGIKHVSLYDHKNGIEAEALFERMYKCGRQHIPNLKWGKSFDEDVKRRSKKLINGFKWNPSLTVHIYKREDGLENIVETIKDLHNSGIQNVDRNELSSRLQSSFSAPDPDLVLICGGTLSYYAFPPWHLRVSQMQILKSHHNLTPKRFLQSLCEYCNSEQRYGK